MAEARSRRIGRGFVRLPSAADDRSDSMRSPQFQAISKALRLTSGKLRSTVESGARAWVAPRISPGSPVGQSPAATNEETAL